MELRCSFYIPSSFFLDKTDHPKPRGLCKRLHVVPFVFFSEPSLWCRLLVSVLCLSPRQFFCVFFRVYLFCLPPRCLFLCLPLRFCLVSFYALSFVQFIEQGKWRSRGLWGRYACSMPPFRPHRAGEMPFYVTVEPISLLDVLHEIPPATE